MLLAWAAGHLLRPRLPLPVTSVSIRAMSAAASLTPQQIQEQIKAQGATLRSLKAAPDADPAAVEEATSRMKELRDQLANLSVGSGGKLEKELKKRQEKERKKAEAAALASAGQSAPAETDVAPATVPSAAPAPVAEGKIAVKTPKGTRDWDPVSMDVRQRIFKTITKVFEAHGAITIDTPVFELREILTGKYGEDGGKLIYDLADQGGEISSLRYDLTVPFARYVAMHPDEAGGIKRYHIAKVYRRDQPVMTKGRFREFYQCDLDIAGRYDPMLPDAEILQVLASALKALKIGNFTIKLNHRKILDAIFAVCGVPDEKIRTISSAVDKMDKLPWNEVRAEMVEEKGLGAESADQIGDYVKLKAGPGHADLLALVDRLAQDAKLSVNKDALAGLEDMRSLFAYLQALGVEDVISFDLSLARGLDYYTGIIYEAVTEGSAPPTQSGGKALAQATPEGEEVDEASVGVGSIAAGGRYDKLVGMFGREDVPCVGVSIGVERVFAIKMAALKKANAGITARAKKTQVFIMNLGPGMVTERLQLAKQLWEAGIRAEFMYKVKPKAANNFTQIERDQTPFAVLVGPSEWKEGKVLVKAQHGKGSAEGASKGETVALTDLVAYLNRRITEEVPDSDEL